MIRSTQAPNRFQPGWGQLLMMIMTRRLPIEELELSSWLLLLQHFHCRGPMSNQWRLEYRAGKFCYSISPSATECDAGAIYANLSWFPINAYNAMIDTATEEAYREC